MRKGGVLDYSAQGHDFNTHVPSVVKDFYANVLTEKLCPMRGVYAVESSGRTRPH